MSSDWASHVAKREAGRQAYENASAEEIEKVEAIISYAARHYNEGGWDLVVECWEPYEVYAYLCEANGDPNTALSSIARDIGMVDDHRRDIQGA
ncbi:hypothetical protein KIKIMORA_01400 [Brevundimonas phage vB_BpoS-Kikimora]|uniref:Uncharacterized protein n=2 Tax=Kikimoravirus TaxID=3425051 RepID=A0A9E7N1T8_9CAUD|nr:hypothetical protein KIKIMORA_01400 [Brevundimonas phage vB_BpoS-Kikimora]UTC28178.1 hypothetical protein GURKE_01470 [Brevundimonas phage vB_BpoS-Gurke]